MATANRPFIHKYDQRSTVMAQNPSSHDGSGVFGHEDGVARDVTENANMDLLCFHVKDDAGRTKFLAVNVLRAHEICSYGDDVRNALVSVGKAGSNGVVHGTFSTAAISSRPSTFGRGCTGYRTIRTTAT